MKVGDTVRIKTNLGELDDENFGIAPEMLEYEGAIAHIVNVAEEFGIDDVSLGYLLDIDNGDWVWSENWLENVDKISEPKEYIDTLFDNLKNEIINVKKERDELKKENKELKERLEWRVNYCQELEDDLYKSTEHYIEKDKVKEDINKIREILDNLNGGNL